MTDEIEVKQQEIAKKLNLNLNKVWISCGHRLLPMFRQLEIIEELGNLPLNIIDKIEVIVTITYGKENLDYIKKVINL